MHYSVTIQGYSVRYYRAILMPFNTGQLLEFSVMISFLLMLNNAILLRGTFFMLTFYVSY